MTTPVYIDTHAHLDDKHYAPILNETVENAQTAGVMRMVLQGCSLPECRHVVEIVENHSALFTTLGCHPHSAKDWNSQSGDELIKLIADCGSKCVGIGEIGLDYHYDFSTPEQQRIAFYDQLRLASQLDLPVVIHCREAWDDTLAALREWVAQKKRTCLFHGIVHCWFGTPEQSRTLRELGFLMGIGGSLTFRKSLDVRDSVQEIPLNSFVLETDAPYLTPVPFRGKPNAPAYIPLIAETVAELSETTVEQVAKITTRNALLVYGRMGLPEQPATVYVIGSSLYIALTNRCSCDCVFCPRETDPVIKGWNLKRSEDPTKEEVFSALEEWGPTFEQYKEVVFCGFGEPTLRLDLLLDIARWAKARGAVKIRVNTNGLSDLSNGEGSVQKMVGFVDTVSISLNAIDKESYNKLNRPEQPAVAWETLLRFVQEAAATLPECIASAVVLPNTSVEPIEKLAKSLGAKFRPRPFEDLG